jgi:hypothetical protein
MEDLKKGTKNLREISKKPIVIQEFGEPSYKGIWNLTGSNQEDQAHYPKKMKALFKKKITLPLCHGPYIFSYVLDVAGK